MGPLGVPELLIILLVALLLFGPRRLPELGRTIGRGLAEFRRASTDLRLSVEEEMQQLERAADAAPSIRPEPRPEPPPAPKSE